MPTAGTRAAGPPSLLMCQMLQAVWSSSGQACCSSQPRVLDRRTGCQANGRTLPPYCGWRCGCVPLDGRCGQVPRPSALSLTCSRSSSLPFLLSVKFLGGRMKSSAEVGRPGNTATRIWSSGTPVTCGDHRVKPWTSQPP